MPLIAAVQYNQHEIAKLMLIAGSDPNAGYGAPLLSAVRNGNVAIAKLLITAGATVSDSIIKIVEREGNAKLLHLLNQTGHDVTLIRVPGTEL